MSLSIHEHIYTPSSTRSPRTLLMLHGTGGNEHDLLPLARMLDPEAAVLSPRGNVLERGMPRFFRRLAEGVFDHEDVARRAAELARWINAALSHYAIERDGLTLVGFSNGANIAAAMMLLRPEGAEHLRSAIFIRAMVPVPAQTSVAEAPAAGAGRPRVLVLAGARDPIVPASNSAELAALLRRRGIETSLEMLHAGHEITREDVTLARTWLGAGGAGQAPGA